MLAIGCGDTWDGTSLRLPLLRGTHCPLCGDTTTWGRGTWAHFLTSCTGARTILRQTPALDWLLHISVAVSPGFALFSAASTFADCASRLLRYIASHGDISPAGEGERLLLDDPAGTQPLVYASPSPSDGSMATIVCLREVMDTACTIGEDTQRSCGEHLST